MVDLNNLRKWSQSGLSANKNLLDFSQQAIKNPNQFLDSLMSGYGGSDIFNKRVNNASNLFRNQMSARGLTGSSFADEKMLSGINDLVGEDMQQYLANNFNVLNAGLGTANNLSSSGLSAENNMQQLQMQQNMFDYEKEQNEFFPQLIKSFVGNVVGGLSGGLGGGLGSMANQSLMQGFGRRNPSTPAGFNYNFNNQVNQGNNFQNMIQNMINSGRGPSFFSTK
jgi:hypothetical protein